MVSERRLIILSAGLLAWAVVSTVGFSYFYQEYNTYYDMYDDSSQIITSREISVNLLVKSSDDGEVWYNNTSIQLGASLIDLTEIVTDVDYESYSFGVYVKSIGGVDEKPEQNIYWFWWLWDDSVGWYSGGVGSDQFRLSDGSVLAWYLQDADDQHPP